MGEEGVVVAVVSIIGKNNFVSSVYINPVGRLMLLNR